MNNHNYDNKKNNFLLDEIISPIFGHEYKNRIVENKNLVSDHVNNSQDTNYLEKQIEEELEAKNKIAKEKEYQESFKSNTDVLKQYHKEKEAKELQAALPSNYLNFRDSLEKNTDDLSIISDFDATTEIISNSISEIVDDIFSD
ncbi:MAG: hypothetical protein REH79_03440 [Spiroplasma sp.]|nr:hypothetical protein [Spiroplasma sp.]